MTPHVFPQANTKFTRPDDMTDQQCQAVLGYKGEIVGGDLDGTPMIVTAWQPDATERARIASGEPIFVLLLAQELPPHALSTRFPIQ